MSENIPESQKVGLVGAVAIIVGCVIGASIFIMLGPITAKTGPSLWVAYALASIPAFIGSIYYMQLGASIPSKGAVYAYTSKLLNPTVGAISCWMFIIAGTSAVGAMAVGFGHYLHHYVAAAPVFPTAIAIILLFYVVNLFGLKSAATSQIIMTFIILGALLMFALPGLTHITEYKTVDTLYPFGTSGLLFGAASAFFSYAGYQIASEMGSEIKNSNRNLPIAIILGLVIVTTIYVLVSYVTNGVISWEVIASAEASVPTAAAVFMPAWAQVILGIGALLGVATTINACLLTFPRDFVVLGESGFLPKAFCRENKAGAPYYSLTFMTIVALLLVILKFDIDMLGLMVVFGFLGAAIMCGIGCWFLPKKYPDLYDSAPIKIPLGILKVSIILGVILNAAFIVIAGIDVPSIFLFVLILLIIALVYSSYRVKRGLVKIKVEETIEG